MGLLLCNANWSHIIASHLINTKPNNMKFNLPRLPPGAYLDCAFKLPADLIWDTSDRPDIFLIEGSHMKMKRVSLLLLCLAFFLACITPLLGQNGSGIVVFSESEFPAADSAAPSIAQLQSLFSGAQFVSVDQLKATLSAPATRLLVLPYGSAFPNRPGRTFTSFYSVVEICLCSGGRPFSRSAFHDDAGWHLRDYNVRFMRALMIDQYQDDSRSRKARSSRLIRTCPCNCHAFLGSGRSAR